MSTSAAKSAPETLPLEEGNPCNVLVVYEGAAARDLAMGTCQGVTARFGDELAFAFSVWEAGDLNDSVAARWAMEAAAQADIILLSLPDHDLTSEISQWLEACARTRTKLFGALALIVAERRSPDPTGGELLSRLQLAAQRMRMDFLPPIPEQKLEPVPASLPWDSTVYPDKVGSDHWGLNE
jgi:hypothetical protein